MACSMIAARSAFVAGASLQQRNKSTAKVSVRAPARKVSCVKASASSQGRAEISRREVISTSTAVAAATLAAPALAGNIPSGFSAVSDSNKNYAFLIPFGWQEVAVDGADVVYKDVIEPLESVSLTILPTQTEKLSDIGSPEKVAQALLDNVLATPAQGPKLVSASSREVEGNTYYTFEYTAQGRSYTRHAVASVSIRDGKFYTLTAGANERRWKKMEKKIGTVAKSFYNMY
eukprot:CAMPEP_0118922534 /NCGR_PEP_ID=MMETSP1169-20130426/1436_1 /TAXON_ID=36882 /ORGANISM="Pyramimonas obovata, Strain CCMP722" /LENGTH=231 /DNA_ID=CAMNT_0006863425 /DNA_START=60 /DNA_END=755 /DNA_ORIENTATION=+